MQENSIATKIALLAKEGDARFLEIGRLLRDYYDTLEGEEGLKGKALKTILKGARISRRRAFYWMEIDRVYRERGINPKRLIQIGWTKLSLVAKLVDDDDVEEWLSFLEGATADAIRAFLKGQELPAYRLTFKLSKAQYEIIAGTLLANGAFLTSGAGLANKELALLKICRTLKKAWDAGIT